MNKICLNNYMLSRDTRHKQSDCIRIGDMHWDYALSIYELSEQERAMIPFWSVAALTLDPDNHSIHSIVFIKTKLAQLLFLKDFLPLAKHVVSINALEELFERDRNGNHYFDRLIEAISGSGF